MDKDLKDLLVRDLCARYPYKLLVKRPDGCIDSDYVETIDLATGTLMTTYNGFKNPIENFKPILRPMSSMTEEERIEYKHLVAFSDSPDGAAIFIDWLNKKMFAYRTIDGKDMFELGLALEAPKDRIVMVKIDNERMWPL